MDSQLGSSPPQFFSLWRSSFAFRISSVYEGTLASRLPFIFAAVHVLQPKPSYYTNMKAICFYEVTYYTVHTQESGRWWQILDEIKEWKGFPFGTLLLITFQCDMNGKMYAWVNTFGICGIYQLCSTSRLYLEAGGWYIIPSLTWMLPLFAGHSMCSKCVNISILGVRPVHP